MSLRQNFTERETGRAGSFEADIEVPVLKTQTLMMSPIVLANQTQTVKKG
ncbi:MAG: hypothetical protein WBV69_10745 [Candidatus Sulfotelmatobacter sp.]